MGKQTLRLHSRDDKGGLKNDSIYQANLEMRGCRNMVHASDDDRAAIDIKNFEDYFFNKK